MNNIKQKYDFFTASGPLTQEKFHDLVRLCGYSPTEKQLNIPIPKDFNEFSQVLTKFEKKFTKEDMYEQLVTLVGGPTITEEELIKILQCGDALNTEEMDAFFRLVQNDDGSYSLKEVVNALYEDE